MMYGSRTVGGVESEIVNRLEDADEPLKELLAPYIIYIYTCVCVCVCVYYM
jgi:hypothetical protein